MRQRGTLQCFVDPAQFNPRPPTWGSSSIYLQVSHFLLPGVKSKPAFTVSELDWSIWTCQRCFADFLKATVDLQTEAKVLTCMWTGCKTPAWNITHTHTRAHTHSHRHTQNKLSKIVLHWVYFQENIPFFLMYRCKLNRIITFYESYEQMKEIREVKRANTGS